MVLPQAQWVNELGVLPEGGGSSHGQPLWNWTPKAGSMESGPCWVGPGHWEGPEVVGGPWREAENTEQTQCKLGQRACLLCIKSSGMERGWAGRRVVSGLRPGHRVPLGQLAVSVWLAWGTRAGQTTLDAVHSLCCHEIKPTGLGLTECSSLLGFRPLCSFPHSPHRAS